MFDLYGDDELRALLRTQAERPDERPDKERNLAVDMLDGNQLKRTVKELQARYPQRQNQSTGERIEPLTLPLAERYISEAATAYNMPVERTIVSEEGVVDDEATKVYTDEIARVGYDEVLHSLERHTILLDSCGLWSGARRGEATGQVVTPQRVHPVMPLDISDMNAADQRDYVGFVIELAKTGQQESDATRYVFVTPAAHYHYESSNWSEIGDYEVKPNEALTWPQAVPTDDGSEQVEDVPLQLLTIWHRVFPTGKLMPPSDASIGAMNLELNVQWSVMMDTLRKQGWGQVVMKLHDASKPPSQIAMGSAFALPMDLDESVESLGHANDYTNMVGALTRFTQLYAVLTRQSTNDYALEGAAPASGFAKLIDSLPKIEARRERVRRLKAMEENYLWPRIGSTLIHLGKLDEKAKQLRARVKFSEVEFPKTIDERTKQEEHDLKHGFTSRARLLAKYEGISVEEADEMLEANKEAGPKPPDNAPPQPPQAGEQPKKEQSLIERLVASKSGVGLSKKETAPSA